MLSSYDSHEDNISVVDWCLIVQPNFRGCKCSSVDTRWRRVRSTNDPTREVFDFDINKHLANCLELVLSYYINQSTTLILAIPLNMPFKRCYYLTQDEE